MKDIDTLRLRQNGRHFPDNIFKMIFFKDIYLALETPVISSLDKDPLSGRILTLLEGMLSLMDW